MGHDVSLANRILAEAMTLSPEMRAFLAEKLIESLDTESDAELSPAWREEVRKRCREIDEGIAQLRDSREVFAKADQPMELPKRTP